MKRIYLSMLLIFSASTQMMMSMDQTTSPFFSFLKPYYLVNAPSVTKGTSPSVNLSFSSFLPSGKTMLAGATSLSTALWAVLAYMKPYWPEIAGGGTIVSLIIWKKVCDNGNAIMQVKEEVKGARKDIKKVNTDLLDVQGRLVNMLITLKEDNKKDVNELKELLSNAQKNIQWLIDHGAKKEDINEMSTVLEQIINKNSNNLEVMLAQKVDKKDMSRLEHKVDSGLTLINSVHAIVSKKEHDSGGDGKKLGDVGSLNKVLQHSFLATQLPTYNGLIKYTPVDTPLEQ